METKEIIRLKGKEKKKIWQEACETLWIEVFGDREQFVKHYMDSTWKRNQVLLLLYRESGDLAQNVSYLSESQWQEKGIASMLHMNPYVLSVGEGTVNVHYIVGVCTRRELRGRGYMGMLLKEALIDLKQQGEPFTYLMPADVEIYLPYGFVPVGFVEKKVYSVWRQEEELETAEKDSIPFESLSGEERQKVLRFAEKCRNGIYVPPNEEYLRELEEQMHTYDGEVVTVWQDGEPIGIVAYLYEEGEIPVEVVQSFTVEEFDERVKEVFYKHIRERFRVGQIQIQYNDMYKISESNEEGTDILHTAQETYKHCFTMVRCLAPEWFLERMSPREGWGQSCTVEIKDEILTENNRVYRVSFRSDGKKNKVTPCMETPEHCMNVETLVKYVLSGVTVYTPELV